jgi:cytoskeletal protein RodZ
MIDLGRDPDAEQSRIREELVLEEEGVKGGGSPYQQTAPSTTETTKPSGDQGRPKGQPTGKNEPVDETKTVKRKTKVQSPSQQTRASTKDQIEGLLNEIRKLPEEKQLKLLKLLDE